METSPATQPTFDPAAHVAALISTGAFDREGAERSAREHAAYLEVAARARTAPPVIDPNSSSPSTVAPIPVLPPALPTPAPYQLVTSAEELAFLARTVGPGTGRVRVPFVGDKFHALIAAGDERAALVMCLEGGQDAHGASEAVRESFDRKRATAHKSVLTGAPVVTLKPAAPAAVPETAEIAAARALVLKAEENLVDVTAAAASIQKRLGVLEIDSLLNKPGTEGRRKQLAADAATARDRVTAAQAALDHVRALLVTAESDAVNGRTAQRRAEVRKHASDYIVASKILDDAFHAVDIALPAMNAAAQALQGYRDLYEGIPLSSRLLGDTRIDAAVSHAGENVRKFLARAHVAPVQRKSLEAMAKAAVGSILADAAPAQQDAAD